MTVYIVQKLHWEWNDEAFVLNNDTPIKAFESQADAEEYRRKCEIQARADWREYWRDHRQDSTYIGERGTGKNLEAHEAFYEVVEMEIELP